MSFIIYLAYAESIKTLELLQELLELKIYHHSWQN